MLCDKPEHRVTHEVHREVVERPARADWRMIAWLMFWQTVTAGAAAWLAGGGWRWIAGAWRWWR